MEDFDHIVTSDYTKGAEDIWKLSKEIFSLSSLDLEKVFGVDTYSDVFRCYSPFAALEKFDSYKEGDSTL